MKIVRRYLVVSVDKGVREVVRTEAGLAERVHYAAEAQFTEHQGYEEAAASVETGRFDAAVVDLVLPRAEGLQRHEDHLSYGLDLALALRQRGVPVVLCLSLWTGEEGASAADDKREQPRVSMHDWILRIADRFEIACVRRPFGGRSLLDAVHALVANRRTP